MNASIITSAERATNRNKMAGLGDLVAKVTDTLGIRKCSACSKRQQVLNKAFPFKRVDQKPN